MKTIKNKLMNFLFVTIVGSLFSWSIIVTIITCTELEPNFLHILIGVFVVMLFLQIVFWNKYTTIGFFSLVFLVLILPCFNLLTVREVPKFYVGIIEFSRQLLEYIMGYISYAIEYDNALTIIISVLICIVTTGFMTKVFLFVPLVIFSATIFGICFSGDFFYFNEAFIVYLFCLLVFVMKRLNLFNTIENEKRSNAVFTICVIPLAIVIIVIALNIPTPHENTSLEWFETAINKPFNMINNMLYEALNPKFFTLNQTGYSSSKNKLGGNVITDDTVVMQISSSDNIPVANLISSYKDMYSNNSWTNTTPTTEIADFTEMPYPVDIMERAISSLSLLDSNYVKKEIRRFANYHDIDNPRSTLIFPTSEFIKSSELVVDILDNRTCTIFQVPFVENIISESDMKILKNGANDFFTDELLDSQSKYTIIYKGESLETGNFYANADYIKYAKRGSYVELYEYYESLRDEFPNIDGVFYVSNEIPLADDFFSSEVVYNKKTIRINVYDLLKDILIKRAEEIYERYTVLPEDFSQRVIDLTYEITDGLEFDYEKAVAIRDYLKQFPYTLMPGQTPYGEDFVDYFLFEQKTGYCTYYATAFATMCRVVDIPTRYVEGFLVNYSGSGDFDVTNRMGHAWAEVYLEGLGWILFEPTPGASGDSYESAVSAFFAERGTTDFENDADNEPPNNQNEFEEMEMLTEPQRVSDISQPSSESETVPLATQTLPPKKKIFSEETELHLFIAIALMIIILIAIFLRILYAIIPKIIEKRLEKLSNNDAVIYYFKKILRYTKYFSFNYEISKNETAIQFSSRVGRLFAFENDMVFMHEYAEIFSNAKYGQTPISTEDRVRLKKACANIDFKLRQNMNLAQYIFCKLNTYSSNLRFGIN